MMKKFLSGVLVTALVLGSVAVASPAKEANAVTVPKAKYTFNMNGKNSKVVAVGRKGDNASLQIPDLTKPNMPTEAQAKSIGASLKYEKGHNGKALFIDRTKSYGAQLKGVNLGSGSWTVSFWVQVPNGLSDYAPVFWRVQNAKAVSAGKNTEQWLSITKVATTTWNDTAGSPVIWSHYLKNGDTSKEQFPWYNKNGVDKNGEAKWEGGEALGKSWTHVVLVVNTKKSCEYGVKGESGYVKGYHAWTYINGKLYGNGAVAKNIFSAKDKFILGINAWDTPAKAYYDDVMLWDKALTAKQVKALYKSQK